MDITLVSRPLRRHRSDTGELRPDSRGEAMVSRDTLNFNLDARGVPQAEKPGHRSAPPLLSFQSRSSLFFSSPQRRDFQHRVSK